MVSIQNGRRSSIPFTQMVDITAQSYQIARQYMIRLSDEDLNDPAAPGRCAALAGLSPVAFRSRFQSVGLNVKGTQL